MHRLRVLRRRIEERDRVVVQSDLELRVGCTHQARLHVARREHPAEEEVALSLPARRAILVETDEARRPLDLPPLRSLLLGAVEDRTVHPPVPHLASVEPRVVQLPRVLLEGAHRGGAEVHPLIEDRPAVGAKDPRHVVVHHQRIEGGDAFDRREVVEHHRLLRRTALGDHLLVHVVAVQQPERGVDPRIGAPRRILAEVPLEVAIGALEVGGVQHAEAEGAEAPFVDSGVGEQHVRVVPEAEVVPELVPVGAGEEIGLGGEGEEVRDVERDHAPSAGATDPRRHEDVELHVQASESVGKSERVPAVVDGLLHRGEERHHPILEDPRGAGARALGVEGADPLDRGGGFDRVLTERDRGATRDLLDVDAVEALRHFPAERSQLAVDHRALLERRLDASAARRRLSEHSPRGILDRQPELHLGAVGSLVEEGRAEGCARREVDHAAGDALRRVWQELRDPARAERVLE